MTPATPIELERDNVNDEFVTLVKWFVRHGDRVENDALIAEVETSKANVEVHAPAAGYLVQAYAEGAEIPVPAMIGQILEQPPTMISPPGRAAAPAFAEPAISATAVAATAAKVSVPRPVPAVLDTVEKPAESQAKFAPVAEYRQRFSPVAAKMIVANGIPLSAFADKSVIRKQDVLDYLNPTPAPAAPVFANGAASGVARRASAKITQPYQAIRLSRMKQSEVANLAAGTCNAISSSVSVTCFTRGLRRILEEHASSAAAVLVFEASRLLRKFPSLNATYRDETMLQYEEVNVGFAMDDGRGLKVATLPRSDELSLAQIMVLLRELTVAYIEDKLTPAQLANVTFTISDLSGLGVSSFQPLISENQGAILGVGGEQFVPESPYGFYSLTLTFDHQLSNGRTAALFLNDLKDRLQSYEQAVGQANAPLVCSSCYRTAAELRKVHHRILLSADGYLCTICAQGW
jgi:pyruvate/2-oxoglutarate dehydrogenase complex dihydrolipoamide acyltransferase (E2) component